MKLWVKILIGVFAGIALGQVLGPYGVHAKPIGTLFINLINMTVVPLVFASMTVGVTTIHDPVKLGRVGMKTMFWYVLTTILAICLGLAIAHFVEPGAAVHLNNISTTKATTVLGIGDLILSIIPPNPIAAMAQGNVLGIIVFSIFLGVAINLSGNKAAPLLRFLESLAEVMFHLTAIVMNTAPYGVCAIMCWVSASFGLEVLIPLVKFLLCNYVGCAIHMFFIFGGMLAVLARLPLKPFFNGLSDAMVMALSTASSSTTLPLNMHCVQNKLGVSRNLTNFILPLGATVNMNGTALNQAISALFVAQAYGIDLNWTQLLTIVFTTTLSAIGTAGIPGGGFVMLSVVLSSVGLPVEGLALLAGVDRLREMVSTMVNITGDAVVAVLIAKEEGELDVAQYLDSTTPRLQETLV